MKKISLLCALFLMILPGLARAESFTGKVISVTDGNTISVMHGTKARQVKIAGVDCPDLDQPYGPEARDFLAALIGGREIWVDVKRVDHFNRGDSLITLNGQDVAAQVVGAGLGWYDTKYTSNAQIAEAQARARDSRSGLWAQEKPVPPWEFRQKSRGIIPNMAAGSARAASPGSGGGWGFAPSHDPTVNSQITSSGPAIRRSSRGWLTVPGPCGPCIINW